MEDRNKKKIMEETKGEEKQSLQKMNPPILPKNIMAVVGDTPVVLGQKYILLQTVKMDSSTVSSGDIRALNPSMKSHTNPQSVRTDSTRSSTVSNDDSFHVTTKPRSLLPDPSHVIRTLDSQKVIKTSHSSSTGASLSQSQMLQNVKVLPLEKKSLLFDDKHQSLSQKSLLADKSVVAECVRQGSFSSSCRLSADQIVLVSKPKKTETVIDLNSINANQTQVDASSNPHSVPSFIVNLPESSGNQGSTKSSLIGDNTKYFKLAHLSQGNTIRRIKTGTSPASHVEKTLKLVGPDGPSISSKGSQSMVIGNIASLSHNAGSHFLSATVQNVKESSKVHERKGIDTVQTQPIRSLLSVPRPTFNTSIQKFSPQACSTLKSILSVSSSAYSNPSMLSYSLPPTVFSLSSSSNIFTDGGKVTPLNKIVGVEDEDPEIKQCSNDIIDYYTSVENHDRGQKVMVMRPRLESDIDCNENFDVGFQSQEQDTKGKVSLSQVSGNYSLTTSSKGSEKLHETVKDDNQCNDAPLSLKIQSVFSLADSGPDFESSNYDYIGENELDTEICHMSDTDTAYEDFETDSEKEEETSFNIHEDEWKKACPMSFVVLERLTHHDIEDKRVGRTKHSVQCSHHCRMRTLSYMCGLNLLNCDIPSHFKDTTRYKKTDIDTSLSSTNEKDVKETHSETAGKPAGLTTTPSCLKKDGHDKEVKGADSEITKKPAGVTTSTSCLNGSEKENKKCEQPAQLCKDKNQTKSNDLKIESCQTLEGETDILFKQTLTDSEITSNIQTETPSLSKSPVITEKDEGEQLKEDLISLKTRIEEKRQRMKLQKAQRNLSSESGVRMKITSLALSKAQSNQSVENLPAKPRSLKKLQDRPALSKAESNPSVENLPAKPRSLKKLQDTSSPEKKGGKALKANLSPSAPTAKAVATSSRAVPAFFIMDCSAPSLFRHFKSRVPNQSAGERFPISSPLPLKKTQPSILPQDNVNVALRTVFSTLKSLADHFKMTGHVPMESQYVMTKINNAPLLLKVSPTDLLTENLDALKKVSQYSSSQLKEQQTNVSQPSAAKPQQIPSAVKPHQIPSAAKPHHIPSAAKPHQIPSAAKPHQIPSAAKPHQILSAAKPHQIPSAAKLHQMPSASKSKPNSQQTRQQQRPYSPIHLSFSEAIAHKQNLSSAKAKTSSPSLKLPIKTKSLTSTFHREPSSSSPMTTKSSSQGFLSNKKKQSINVPCQGSAPRAVEHSRNNNVYSSTSNSSLCSLLTTGQSTSKNTGLLTHVPMSSSLLPEKRLKRPTDTLSKEERADKRRRLEQKYPLPPGLIIKSEPDTSEYELDSNWSVTSCIQSDYLTSPEMAYMEADDCPMTVNNASGRSHMIVDENQQNGNPRNSTREDSPPHLESFQSCQRDTHSDMTPSAIEIEDDEEPPVLQPMPSTSFQQITSQADKALNRMSASQVSDSGYDSVCPSSSNESMESQQTPSKHPFTKMSKIQQLKELLKAKQLEVENMLKKRSELPQVDLNAM